MSNYQIAENRYVTPTPAGAYYAVSSQSEDIARKLLLHLLAQSSTQLFDLDELHSWGFNDEHSDDVLDLIHRMQNLGWIQGSIASKKAPLGTIEEELPHLLEALTINGKALLADGDGFYLATHGFPHEAAEEISALSADLSKLHDRHEGLLKNNLSITVSAWGVIDAAGNSQLGFWPIYIGSSHFVLVLSGLPNLNQSAFVDLVWLLGRRYS
ncbi:MAG: hypothetical protein L3J70_06155 [Gammaproteobacteria bacterium]|nr:hypothetical protein [Gammaproteobacteria bacterium]